VFSSGNNGTNWIGVSKGLPPNTAVGAFALSGTNLFAGGTSGLYLSTDYGTNWNQVGAEVVKGTVYALLISGTNLFAGTDSSIFLSTNNGTSWTTLDSGLPKPLYARDFAVVPKGTGGTNLFVGTYFGVFLSTNNGTVWTATSSTNGSAYRFAVPDSNLFVGTRNKWSLTGGVFLSADNAASWTSVDADALGMVAALVVSGTNLFAATSGSRSWMRPLSEMITTSVGSSSAELPMHFSLNQNYPNPFNPNTIIKFELPKASQVSLTVYDMLGRKVSVLVNEKREAGVHEVKFEGSNLASGVYFYRLSAVDFVSTKRMLVLK
jgi:hypothetical protein